MREKWEICLSAKICIYRNFHLSQMAIKAEIRTSLILEIFFKKSSLLYIGCFHYFQYIYILKCGFLSWFLPSFYPNVGLNTAAH